jgi:hypothetical protein
MEECPLANPTPPLSPFAQAVWDAYKTGGLGAALRAAVDRTKLGPDEWEGSKPDDFERGWNRALSIIAHVANELRQEGASQANQ